jgi:hypothetical protein
VSDYTLLFVNVIEGKYYFINVTGVSNKAMLWYRHFKIRNARFDDLTKRFNHINFNEVISGMSLISIALLDTPVTLIK